MLLFLEVLQNYTVLHTQSAQQALYHLEEDGSGLLSINFADDNDGNDLLYFDPNAEVDISTKDASAFSVNDTQGNEIHFTAYAPAQLFQPQGDRDINLMDLRLEVTEPNRVWVKVGKFDVLLNHTDEGIVVDVWPWVPKDAGILPDESLASCYAFDADADAALEGPEDEA